MQHINMISPILSSWHCQGGWVGSTHPFALLTLLDVCGKSGILQAWAAKESRDSCWKKCQFSLDCRATNLDRARKRCFRISHAVPVQWTRTKSLDHNRTYCIKLDEIIPVSYLDVFIQIWLCAKKWFPVGCKPQAHLQLLQSFDAALQVSCK